MSLRGSLGPARAVVGVLGLLLIASGSPAAQGTATRTTDRLRVGSSVAADDPPPEFETWRVKATLLVLVEREGSTTPAPAYKVVTWDQPAQPNTERAARHTAAEWALHGVFVPGPEPPPAETVGTHYPAHRVQGVEVYVVY